MADVQPLAAATYRWPLTVSCTLPDTNVRLSWPDLSQLPRTLRPILTDTVTGTRVYMRTATGYTFPSGPNGTSRQFVLTAETSGSLLALTGLAAQPTSAGIAFSYTLSAGATVCARVRNLAGRPVRTLASGLTQSPGLQSLLWNGRSDAGQRVPAGVYLLEVTATSEIGQRVQALTAVSLRR